MDPFHNQHNEFDTFVSSTTTAATGRAQAAAASSSLFSNLSDFRMTDDLLLQFGGEDDDVISNAGSFSLDVNDWSQVSAVPPHQVQMQLQQHPFLQMQQQQQQPHRSSFDATALTPTPIGRSCQIVPDKGQVPLNQSLLSQSESLAGMLRRLEEEKAVFDSMNANSNIKPSPASLMPTLGSLFGAVGGVGGPPRNSFVNAAAATSTTASSTATPATLTEADFGPVGCPSSVPASATVVSANSASTSISSDDSVAAANRSQQSTRWNQRFQELLEYRNQHADCNVPYLWPHNRPLSEWVKRQRHQFKLKMEGRHSALTEKRQSLLTSIGFVWNSRASLWDARYQELVEYCQEFGNVRVTKKTSQHRALSVWLKRQRHAARMFLTGDDSTCMTEERLQKLLDLGVKITKSN